MRKTLKRINLIFLFSSILLAGTMAAWGQNDRTPKKRLKAPATVKGLIGGEAHDSFVIRARRGQTMTVQIYWKKENDNQAEFTVSRSANFFGGERVKFGKESNQGRRWQGKIPVTTNYYIYVVAHPSAKYSLKVNLK
jgi:hypothetical protein